ncbi:tannase/feruloyl esterase family alpha/beta hydrolase [Phenylobacterium sp.]|jgi:pimeloyl-ACP methyl ester carboxylesterase|uniref:tannase/feruloyl esterase family alpha/beta hydrolase n=1 Tax=Phenylobacterium sp. TaxID=1871053 RepID=UPI0037CB40DA
MKRFILAAAMALAAAPVAANAETDCTDLAALKMSHAEVTSARLETLANGSACRVSVTSRPTPTSDIRIEVWIPVGAAWNGKFVQVGNGGLAGAIPVAQIRLRAEAGYAAAGTDDGHVGNGRTAVWALGYPEKIRDFGTRSLKETADAAKALIRAQKGDGPSQSYFAGCSAGGREALMMAQRYPTVFDGIVAGAPANYNTLITGERAYMQQMLARPGAYLAKGDLQLLQDAALKTCAAGGAFIRDQKACRFDPGVLQCKAGAAPGSCLTAPQVAAARALYTGRPGPNGRSLFPGYTPGAEAMPGGYQAWNTGASMTTFADSAGHTISSQFMKYFIYGDPAFDFLKADMGPRYDRDSRKAAAELDAVNPDLRPFKAHGGKLIQYHGWNDPAIPPLGSIRYHGEMRGRMGDTSDFYRLYMVPGMLHCAGGAGPGRVDYLDVLDRWVTKREAPQSLIARADAGDETQLLCPYPGVARGNGKGGWACAAPKPKG